MIAITSSNLTRARKRVEARRPFVVRLDGLTFQANGYQVRFMKRGNTALAHCECPAGQHEHACYHIVACLVLMKTGLQSGTVKRAI